MERKRIGAVVASIVIVIAVIIAGWWIFLRSAPPTPPESDTVVLSVSTSSDFGADSYGNVPAAGNAFVNVGIHVVSNLSAAITLRNGSFSMDTNQTTYSGNVASPGTLTLAPLAIADVSVYFEVPVGGLTSRIRLSEGAAKGSVAFVHQVVAAGLRLIGTAVSSSTDGTNWTVTFPFGPADLRPETTYLLVRNDVGNIILPKTSFGWLSWSVHDARFVDASPAVSTLRPGDGLLVSKTAYPAESIIEISEDAGLLASHVLR